MWFCSQERTKSMCFIFTKFLKTILPDRVSVRYCVSVGPEKDSIFKDKRFPGKIYTRSSFYTTIQECFRFYGHQFYMDAKKVPIISCYNECQKDKSIEYSEFEQNITIDNNIYKTRKTVPKLVHKWLTPRALAYW